MRLFICILGCISPSESRNSGFWTAVAFGLGKGIGLLVGDSDVIYWRSLRYLGMHGREGRQSPRSGNGGSADHGGSATAWVSRVT